MSSIRLKKLSPNAILPTYGSAGAAAADLYACLEAPVQIAAAWLPSAVLPLPIRWV